MTYQKNRDLLRLYFMMPVAPHFRRAFKRLGAAEPEIRLGFTDAGNPPHDVLIEREGRRLTLVIENSMPRIFTRSMRHMTCAYAYWLGLAAPRVNAITVNASDGDQPSNARFAASVRFDRHVALPDPHFFAHLGFEVERRQGETAPAWHERSAQIVWRGATTGRGWVSLSLEDATNPAVVQRLRMVMLARRIPDADIHLVSLPNTDGELAALARHQGLLGVPMPASSWLGRKFAIDIDGFTNTWSNLLVRMLFGCCVLKVESQFGYRQWYYDELRPFEHYVPVRADMADLGERIEWLRTHDAEARAIAERGQALARSLTFSSEAQRAARLIEAHAG